MSVVLDNQPNANYQPSETEIRQYGEFLGMKFPQDNCFLWIAREGLKEPLPEHWKACKSDQGELYYYNFKTGESIWDHPMDNHYKELFKTEKKNPSLRSIENGAKKTIDMSSIPIKKKKKSFPSEEEGDEAINSQHNGRVTKLNSLKLNKVLPESLKIDFDSGTNKGGNKGGSKGGLENHNSKPLQHESPSIVPESILTSGKRTSSDEVIASGFNGLKALSKISLPTNEKNSPDGGDGGLASNKNRSSPNRASTPIEKESVEKKKDQLRTQMSEELATLRRQLESENEKAIVQYREKMDQTLISERRKIDDSFSAAMESLRKEYSDQKDVERRLLEKEFALKLEEEKRILEDSFKNDVKELLEKKERENQKREELSADESRKILVDLQQFGASFVQIYEDNFAIFSQSVTRSFSEMNFKQQKIDQEKKELELELRKITEDNRTLVLQEKEKLLNEMDELKRNHLRKIAQMNATHEEELSSIQSNYAKLLEQAQMETKRLQSLYEQQLQQQEELKQSIEQKSHEIDRTSASAMASNAEELEKLKRELIENAKAEIKSAVNEINENYSAHVNAQLLAVPPSNNSAAATKQGETLKTVESLSAVAVEPPSTNKLAVPFLDKNELLKSPQAVAMNATEGTVSSPQKREDMRTLLVDVLRDVFAKSPFIIPSPSPRARERDHFTAPLPLNSLEGTNDVVESERQRLLQAELFISSQKQNLEQRRRKLRLLRNQWKERVLLAKSSGVRSNSQKGKELKAQGISLESKSAVLDRELAVVYQSELWLKKMKLRLGEYVKLVEDYSRRHHQKDRLNWSVDTTNLMSGFFSPDGDGMKGGSESADLTFPLSPLQHSRRSRSPMLANALQRIEKRLDKVSNMIDQTNRRAQTGRHHSASPSKYSPNTPLPQSARRLRQELRGGEREEQGRTPGKTAHIDPLSMS